MCVYVCVCVCTYICVCMYLPNPPHGQVVTQGQFLGGI